MSFKTIGGGFNGAFQWRTVGQRIGGGGGGPSVCVCVCVCIGVDLFSRLGNDRCPMRGSEATERGRV